MKHKHAGLIKAWADGAEIEVWNTNVEKWLLCGPNISWDECREFRITEVPQWRKDMAQAIKDGKAVQYLNGHSDWIDCPHTIEYFLNRNRWLYEIYYRIKPEPKPDVVKFFHVDKKHIVRETGQYYSHLKLIWDGESGALKGTEVLK